MVGHWLFIGARVYTQPLREDLDSDGYVAWSAPSALERGDLALLYEMRQPDQPGDCPGRMQVGWLLRARTRPRSDTTWRQAADYDAIPIEHPLPLTDIRRALNDYRRDIFRQKRYRRLESHEWGSLLDAVDTVNAGLAARLKRDPDALFSNPCEGVGYDNIEFPAGEDDGWRTEPALEASVRDLMENEGWSSRPTTGPFSRPTLQGHYYVPEIGRTLDDVCMVRSRHLVVVEYERYAHGDPKHGVRQALSYRNALRQLSELRNWRVDALVIAMDFSSSEVDLARDEDVECMEAGRNRFGQTVLTDQLQDGPVARFRAERKQQKYEAARAYWARHVRPARPH